MEVLELPSALGHHTGYFVHFQKNIQELADKIFDLESLMKDIEWNIIAANVRGDIIYEGVEKWLKKVKTILKDAEQLNACASEINSCFKGWFGARYSFGKKSKKMLTMVMALLNEGLSFGDVSFPAPREGKEFTQQDEFEEAFESQKPAMDAVLKAVIDDNVSLIGVCGIGGVGKTTLVKRICNQPNIRELFSVVIMVVVSQNLDLRRIQNEIAEQLYLNIEEVKEESKARRIFKRLKREPKVLIILDDLWSRLELDEVGIPNREHHFGCKVILATRSQQVCKIMKTQVCVRLPCLSLNDSWILFSKNAFVGHALSNSTELARDVFEHCKGLPAAIVALGRAMRDRDQSLWQDLLGRLHEPHNEGHDSVAFNVFKLSYDSLRFQETRLIFLFCSIFPEGSKIYINQLLMFVTGEHLLGDVSLYKGERKVHNLIDELISSSLLLKGDTDRYILMHDVIRDVAIDIASKDQGFIVRTGRGLEAWPEEVLECRRLSLMGSQISDLPERPELRRILTLSLSRCKSLKKIPERFFEGMSSLVALDLSYTSISSLPSSLACLQNLRSLSLDGCYGIKDVSLVEKLKNIEMITLRHTHIKMVPVKQLRGLSKLKVLALAS